jgi:N-acetylmuramoyl-L-alanine amidase
MGIIADLSKWQGDIDFSQLKGQVDGVILRVQAGSTNPDQKYAEYVAGCKANNIPFYSYAYFKGISVSDAIKESEDAYNRMDKDSKGFALDIEEVTMNDLVTGGQAFVDNLRNHGVPNIGLYSGENFYKTHNLQNINVDWTWIAKYGINDGNPHAAPNIVGVDLWQFSSVAHLPGIKGNVDVNMEAPNADFHLFDHTLVIPTVVKPAPKQVVGRVVILAENLRIRSGAGTNFPIVGQAVTGKEYEVFDYQNDWYEIADGQWIFGNGEMYVWLSWRNDGRPLQPDPRKPKITKPVYYVIKNGDTLSKLAKLNGVSMDQLKAWNGIKNINRIFCGQKIRIK